MEQLHIFDHLLKEDTVKWNLAQNLKGKKKFWHKKQSGQNKMVFPT